MPITPDQPFPKKQGDNIRSKDWNDAVNEIIRLDTAKLTLATGGALSGALSINTPVNVSPVVNLRQTTPSWSSVDIFKDFRYIRTEFAGAVSDGPFRQFNVGAGGVSIGYNNVPSYGSGHALYVNGQVGIGTNTPDRALTVFGAGDAYLNVKGNGGAQEILLGADGAGGIVSTMTNHDLQLRAGGNDTKLTIKANGNVGIGTTDPAGVRLAISGVPSWSQGLRLVGNSANGVGMIFENQQEGGHKFSLLAGGSSNGPGNLLGGFGLYDASVGAYRLVVDSGGQLGVGVGDPGFRLDVLGRVRLREGGGTAGHWLYQSGGDRAFIGMSSDTQVGFWGSGLGWGLVMNTNNGLIGVGTTNPTRGRLEVIGSAAIATGDYGYLNIGGASKWTNGAQTINYSIWANQRMAAAEFNAFSDERIKHVRGRSDGAADLRTLLALEVTDYTYKDVIEKGDGRHKKLVAQQVERVFPQAVSRQTEVVPDIFRQAAFADGWVELANDLKAGERVRLIADKTEGVFEVLEAEQDRFRTEFAPEGDKVFVYGREVDDFRVLDYDAVAMLNVSATQQLKREKDEEVRALREECARLRASHDALAERLRLLEGVPQAAPAFQGSKNGSNGNGRH